MVEKVKEYIYNPEHKERLIVIVTLNREERGAVFHELIGDYYSEPIQADRNPWTITFLDSKNQVRFAVFSTPHIDREMDGLEIDHLLLTDRVDVLFRKVDYIRGKLRRSD
jgi:hypothetical protein